LGAADPLTVSPGLKIEPELQERYSKALAEGREKLSQQEFQSVWEAGKTWISSKPLNLRWKITKCRLIKHCIGVESRVFKIDPRKHDPNNRGGQCLTMIW
jgi:hypothetical protein